MKNFKLLVILFFCCSFSLSASHYVGGEVYWKCISGTGKYVFYLDYYRDCSANTADIGQGPVSLRVYNAPLPNNGTLSSIQLTFIPLEPGTPFGPNGGASIAPFCNGCANSSQQISCVTEDQGTLEKYSYRSQPITLTGKPPTAGWVFGYTAACCRSGDVKNLASTGTSSMFKAIMYSDGRASQDPCYDSSPLFKEEPSAIICEGYDFQFSNGAQDAQYDSLSYRWANVVNSSSSPTNYQPVINNWGAGYSLNAPTPTAAMNPLNKSATIDPVSGNIRMFAILPGNVPANKAGIYVTSAQVDAWRMNPTTGKREKIATVFRDMPFNIFRCPNINFTFNDLNGTPVVVNQVNKPPFIFLNNGRNAKSIDTTITLGDSLQLDYVMIDSNTSPCNFNQLTEVSIQPSGAQFDSTFSNVNGNCMQPPCATLTPAPVGRPMRLTGLSTVGTQFNWKVDCAHLMSINNSGTLDKSRVFQFVFQISDDFCAVPAVNYSTLNVTVKLPETPQPPKVYCFNESGNGISFSFESLSADAIRNPKFYVYLGLRLKGSSTAFTFLPSPADTINSYTGVWSFSAAQLDPTLEYAIKLRQVDSICGLVRQSANSSIASNSQSDSIQFQFIYKGSLLSIQNKFAGSSLQWFRNGVAISNATNNSISILNPGSYEIEVTIGGCTFRSKPYVITVVGIENKGSAISALSIFPNPTTNQINIGGLSENEQVKSIRVYNLNGDLVSSVFKGKSIDLSALRNQLYLIRIETSTRVITKKVIKQ
jgi:hypothetical protein